ELASGQLVRERSCETALAHPRQLVRHPLLDVVESRRLDALGLELCAEDDDRVPRPPLVELALGAVRTGIAARVTDEAVGESLDERGPLARTGVRDSAVRRLADRPHAHAVDRLCRDLHDLGACADLAGCHR